MRHRAGDRDHLAVGQREIGDAGTEVDRQAHPVGDRARLATNAARVEKEGRTGAVQPVERQVGGHVEGRHDAVVDVLVDRHQPGANGLGRRVRNEGGAVELHAPGLGPVDPADHPDQGRLAGTVGAHQHGDFAGGELEAHAVQDLVGPKGLLQADEAEYRRRAQSIPPTRRC